MANNVKKPGMGITVDDGGRRVPIMNIDGEEIGAFRFHPTDLGIIERYNRLAEKFDAITEPLEALNIQEDAIDDPDGAGMGSATEAPSPTPAGSPLPEGGARELTDPRLRAALSEAEGRLNAAVNELFGSEDAAAAFFGKMHPFSPVNGEFYATQVLQKVGAFIGAQFDTETKAMSKRARKYLK